MWKAVVAGTAVLAIAGSTLVYAQQRGRPDALRRGPNIEDMRAFGEARLAGLKAGLTLTAEQEKNWPAFEQAAREFGKLRLDRISARVEAMRSGNAPSRDPAERLRQRGATMSETGAALKKLGDAVDPLYKSLDDGQKRRFAILARISGQGFGREGGGREEFRGRGEPGPRGSDGPRRMEHRPFEGGPGGFDTGRRRSDRGPDPVEPGPSRL
jgi:zinc resistance-associated protein